MGGPARAQAPETQNERDNFATDLTQDVVVVLHNYNANNYGPRSAKQGKYLLNLIFKFCILGL